ncbi:hypothetical protein GUJ93_ZPchr0009g1146 [Zizania palustris]|uniref:Uncharacterized protein n=1 Tax=Zizania palustris TaxID=103762 RepID=A0A8J5UXG3_ZIZPA|nr:hypothetical protein GUJ93_ZPchr0009g1146 [Zizania palustris]
MRSTSVASDGLNGGRGGVLDTIGSARALKTQWICSGAGGLGKAKSGGRRGTLNGLVDDINRAVVASSTRQTMQVDKQLGIADNGVRNPDSDGRTNNVGGCTRYISKNNQVHKQYIIQVGENELVLKIILWWSIYLSIIHLSY